LVALLITWFSWRFSFVALGTQQYRFGRARRASAAKSSAAIATARS
jgi:hypothetical protein